MNHTSFPLFLKAKYCFLRKEFEIFFLPMKVSVKRLKAENKADLMAVFDKLLFSVTNTCSLFDSILID